MHIQLAFCAMVAGLAVEEAAGAEQACGKDNVNANKAYDEISTMLESDAIFLVKTTPALSYKITGIKRATDYAFSQYKWWCEHDGSLSRVSTSSLVTVMDFQPSADDATKCQAKLSLEFHVDRPSRFEAFVHSLGFDKATPKACKQAVETKSGLISSSSTFRTALGKYYAEQLKAAVGRSGVFATS